MMRKLLGITKTALVFATIFFLCLSSLPRAFAQTPGASGLSISPTRSELTLTPGQADKVTITIKNITSGPIVAKPAINDFESDNTTGNPKIITSNTSLSTSIKPFSTGLDNVPLNPGEQKNVDSFFQAPKDAAPGAYYGLISYKAVPSGSGALAPGSVSLSATVSTIVLITVPGNVTERVQLSDIKIYSNTLAGTFFTTKPNKIGIEINNLGNSFVKPFGKVIVTNTLGKQIYSYEVNNTDPRANVLPKSKRTFMNDLKNINKPGRYTITASLSYGSGSNILAAKKTFWYLPVWLIIIIIAVLTLLGVLTYLAYRRLRGRRYRHNG